MSFYSVHLTLNKNLKSESFLIPILVWMENVNVCFVVQYPNPLSWHKVMCKFHKHKLTPFQYQMTQNQRQGCGGTLESVPQSVCSPWDITRSYQVPLEIHRNVLWCPQCIAPFPPWAHLWFRSPPARGSSWLYIPLTCWMNEWMDGWVRK